MTRPRPTAKTARQGASGGAGNPTPYNDRYEFLNTLLTEAQAIASSRLLVMETINTINSEVEISPSQNLIMRSRVAMSPPGVLGKFNLYWKYSTHW